MITFGWSAQRQLIQRQQQQRATLAMCQALQRDRLLRTCANSLQTIVAVRWPNDRQSVTTRSC